ncbi:alanyl-tRNA editing protein [Pseudomonas vlassakiae]|uniref:alanyl-tRNA editing protein n=1 Tax=Pseudomonas vlassakiae TaxID=485888 RepID=UPI0021CA8E2A|nr:alanyl-tRNA editing protein [Pseudomonas vlassakiae]MCU0126922.1 alanyl-tRNA editing protein [Pseudomonas vlassakiae]
MTQRAYYTSDELTLSTHVVRCTPMEDGRFRVDLAETLFHPQGGGQLADQGTIAGIRVEEVLNIDGDVAHVLGQPVPVGSVRIAISPEVRALHARLHSAGHLIAGIGQNLGWLPSKGHHWPGECRVVFERQGGCEPLTVEGIEAEVNALIERDVPRELIDQDGVRSVRFGTLPMHGCGGTHVTSTRMIGPIKVLKLKEKKGLLSVHYDVAR